MTNKDIQKQLNVTGRTVRRWAKQFNWGTYKINKRVIRFNADDIEKTMNVSLEA